MYLNVYYRSQAISGQQRYATEIERALQSEQVAYQTLGPSSFAKSRYLQWVDLQATVPLRAANGMLLSLTARAPAFCRRHVVTIHDLFPLTNPEWFSPSYARLHAKLLQYHMQNATGIAVVSEPILRQVRAVAAPRIPVRIVPNATTRLSNAQGLSEPVAELPAKYFLTVGNLEPRKNLARLLEAHRLLPKPVRQKFPLVIVGASYAAFSASRIGGVVDDPYVFLTGRLSDETLSGAYAHAFAFVSVSLNEGFGIPVLEAASHFCPRMILSDIESYRWVAAESPGITYVNPGSLTAIRDGMLSSIDTAPDPVIAEIAQRFRWEDSASALIKLCDEAIQTR